MALDGAHKTRPPSCDDPAQVPGRKMYLKAGIVQPRSGDTAAGEVVDWAGATVAGCSKRQECDQRELLGHKSSKTTEIYPYMSNRAIGG